MSEDRLPINDIVFQNYEQEDEYTLENTCSVKNYKEEKKEIKEKPEFDLDLNAMRKEEYNNFDNCSDYPTMDRSKKKKNSNKNKNNEENSIDENLSVQDKIINNNPNILLYEPDSKENKENILMNSNIIEKNENNKELNINYPFILEINEIYNFISIYDIEKYIKIKKNNSQKNKKFTYEEKPIFNIPTEKIKEQIKNKENIENLKKDLISNPKPKINNVPFIYQNNNNLFNYSNINNPFIINNINGGININNILYSFKKYLDEILQQINYFQILKNWGINALMKPDNINKNLLYIYRKNNYNNNINLFNNYVLYSNYNNYRFNNPLLSNYFPNNNLININNMSNIINYNNKNNYNQEKYTITFKSETKDPNIEKVSKIRVTTSYVKDNLNINQENRPAKNEKKLINIKDIELNKETRTVVRLNPIPPNYSSFDISKLLDKYLKIETGKNQRIYKALYVPLCKIIGKNLGYCFVMMAKPKYVIEFYKTFEGRSFGKKKCKKPCSVIWADIQGEAFLKNNEEDPIRKPIIFKDLRDD